MFCQFDTETRPNRFAFNIDFLHEGVTADSYYQSTIDAVYVYEVPWSEFPSVPSSPPYPPDSHPVQQALVPRRLGKSRALCTMGSTV